MEERSPKKRRRDVAHLWADKRAVRFFRKNFDKLHYKNLRSIYLALCEIDSDFREDPQINGFTKTVATYAGMNDETVRPYLKALQKAGIIDFQQQNVDGRFGGTILFLYAWGEDEEDFMREKINSVLGNKMKRTKPPKKAFTQEENPYRGKPVYGKTRIRENPYTGKPVYGKPGPFKNNNILLNIHKNSFSNEKESKNISPSKQTIPTSVPTSEGRKGERKGKKPSTQERNKNYLPIATTLAEIIKTNKNVKIDQTKIKSWANEIRKLVETDGIDPIRINAALDWYAENIGDKYVPVIESGTTFRSKFIRLEEAMKRDGITPPQSGCASKPKASPQKLIKDHFPNSILRKAFLNQCYKPAKQLFNLDGASDSLLLIQKLLEFHSQIVADQSKNLSEDLRRLLPGPIALVSDYLAWAWGEDWITDPKVNMLDISHGLFSRFRRVESLKDNHERDPLTGRSYLRE